MTAARFIRCPNCARRFADNNAVFSHIKKKHGGKGISAFRPQHEPSMAELLVEARIERTMGNPVDDDLADILAIEDGL